MAAGPRKRTQPLPGLALSRHVLVGGVVAIGLIFMTLSTQHILSSEAALIGLLEMMLGPIFVFAGVGERPSEYTIVAGVVLLSTLAVHECLAMREEKAIPAAAGAERNAMQAGGEGQVQAVAKANERTVQRGHAPLRDETGHAMGMLTFV